MAEGLGQFSGAFAAPEFPGGGYVAWEDLAGVAPGDPAVQQPRVGGIDPYDPAGGGAPRIQTAEADQTMTAAAHWSNLFDFQHSPMPYLLLLVLAMFGIVQLQIAARIGRRS